MGLEGSHFNGALSTRRTHASSIRHCRRLPGESSLDLSACPARLGFRRLRPVPPITRAPQSITIDSSGLWQLPWVAIVKEQHALSVVWQKGGKLWHWKCACVFPVSFVSTPHHHVVRKWFSQHVHCYSPIGSLLPSVTKQSYSEDHSGSKCHESGTDPHPKFLVPPAESHRLKFGFPRRIAQNRYTLFASVFGDI